MHNDMFDKIKKAIVDFRKAPDKTVNPISMARYHGVKIAHASFDHPKLKNLIGYYKIEVLDNTKYNHTICCSDTIQPNNKWYAFVLAHELGHHFMYVMDILQFPKQSMIVDGLSLRTFETLKNLNAYETACNMFAREMLLPVILFLKGIEHYSSIGFNVRTESGKNSIISLLSNDFNVPEDHVHLRMEELGVL